MIAAQAGIEVAKAQKEQTRLTRYPTLAVKGSVSQAINGKTQTIMKTMVYIVPSCLKPPVSFIKVDQFLPK